MGLPEDKAVFPLRLGFPVRTACSLGLELFEDRAVSHLRFQVLVGTLCLPFTVGPKGQVCVSSQCLSTDWGSLKLVLCSPSEGPPFAPGLYLSLTPWFFKSRAVFSYSRAP